MNLDRFLIVQKAGLRAADLARIVGVSEVQGWYWTSGKRPLTERSKHYTRVDTLLSMLELAVETGKLPRPDRERVVQKLGEALAKRLSQKYEAAAPADA